MELLFQCPDCNRKYKNTNGLIQHAIKIHDKELNNVDVAGVKRVAPKKSNAKRIRRERRAARFGRADGGEANALRIESEIAKRARSNPDDCSICMEAPAGTGAVIPCGHSSFCYPCLKAWGKLKGCPICRGDITLIQELHT